jgi:ribose 5-phosphate isomerase A
MSGISMLCFASFQEGFFYLNFSPQKESKRLKDRIMENKRDDLKKRAAERAVEFIRDGQLVGLGTGSTTLFALQTLGTKVREGMKITGVPTSKHTETIAREFGIPLTDLNQVEKLDIVIDGADEVDNDFNMIKGGGGALTREKLVAISANLRVNVVDEEKLVSRLGKGFAVPVEVLPFAWSLSARLLKELGCNPKLREKDGRVFATDNDNYILDCKFDGIEDVAELEKSIKLVPGVLECGLFVGICDVIIVGFDNRAEVRYRK